MSILTSINVSHYNAHNKQLQEKIISWAFCWLVTVKVIQVVDIRRKVIFRFLVSFVFVSRKENERKIKMKWNESEKFKWKFIKNIIIAFLFFYWGLFVKSWYRIFLFVRVVTYMRRIKFDWSRGFQKKKKSVKLTSLTTKFQKVFQLTNYVRRLNF